MTQTTDGGAPPTDPSRVTTDVLDDAPDTLPNTQIVAAPLHQLPPPPARPPTDPPLSLDDLNPPPVPP
ncbi:hypothetical protein, partial [Cellulosimicrobium funkei]|uniref:hypothetical protein n=1 Tax=Cellulosimicrobium funkei TaxID=264251 RepID=UPI003F8FF3B4